MSLKWVNAWSVGPLILALFFIAPVIIVLSSLFGDYSDNWSHLYDYVLIKYIKNSLILVIGVSISVLVIGITTAWLVTNYNFSCKNIFEWALILPFAVPPYILAYTSTEMFDSYGTANNIIRNVFSLSDDFIFFPKLRNMYGAIMVFSFTLYPYVYLVSRMAFINQSKSILESARTLGYNQYQVFYKLSIPMIRPAVVAGLMIVIMETLSDFGAVDHFAISTFTTGIFRTWYGLYDLQTAMQLSSLLLLFVMIFIFIEKYSRRRASFSLATSVYKPIKKINLFGFKNILAFSFCFIPILIGFLLPVIQLTYWALNYKLDFFNAKFIITAWNTLYLAIIASFFCTLFALIMNFSIRLKKNRVMQISSSFLTVGYAVPGLILAIGIMQLLTFLDRTFSIDYLNLVLTGGLFGLILAYVIKSFALSSSTLEAGFQRINRRVDDVAKSLNSNGWSLLTKIHIPLLRTSILTSMLLVISEVIKELPATLILRPFNFDTLAVSTYIFAAEERMIDAAAPAIAIVIVGLLPIIVLTRLIRKSRPAYRENDNHYQSY